MKTWNNNNNEYKLYLKLKKTTRFYSLKSNFYLLQHYMTFNNMQP